MNLTGDLDEYALNQGRQMLRGLPLLASGQSLGKIYEHWIVDDISQDDKAYNITVALHNNLWIATVDVDVRLNAVQVVSGSGYAEHTAGRNSHAHRHRVRRDVRRHAFGLRAVRDPAASGRSHVRYCRSVRGKIRHRLSWDRPRHRRAVRDDARRGGDLRSLLSRGRSDTGPAFERAASALGSGSARGIVGPALQGRVPCDGAAATPASSCV